MKKFIITICAIFIATVASADTLNVTWHNEDGTTYDTTMCTVGGTLNLPTAPTKRGYTFQGWRNYRPIEYLEFTGTQKITVDTTYTSLYHHGQLGINFTDTANRDVIEANGSSLYIGNKRFCFWTTGEWCAGSLITSNTKYSVDYIASSSQRRINVNGAVSTTSGSVGSHSVSRIRISANNSKMLKAKIYYVKILDANGDFIVDLIPVLDGNGVACMFDKVSKQFFYNSGTGDFVAGPEITE